MKKTLITNLTFGALLLLTSFAHAATFESEPCATTDVTANLSDAYLCAGSFEGNDSALEINNMFGQTGSSVIWEEAAKLEIPQDTADGVLVIGENLEATAGESGSWTYTSGDPLSSPFVIILKASSEYSAYLFKGIEDIVEEDTGTFFISFLNNGGLQPALSHISIYSTNSDIPGGGIFGNPVPLPAALWLFGPALLGFMGFRRKTKS